MLVDVGLCISFYDLIEVGDPYIYPSEGSSHQKVKFRLGNVTQSAIVACGTLTAVLVVFRPFIGEVLTGRISSCKEDGIKSKSHALILFF